MKLTESAVERYGDLASELRAIGFLIERDLEWGQWRSLLTTRLDGGGQAVVRLAFAQDNDRLDRELGLQRRVSHERLCPFTETGQLKNGQVWISRPYVVGSPLEATGNAPVDQARQWLGQMSQGLGELHRLGLLHRQLKPANVILGEKGAVLTDIGLPPLADNLAGGDHYPSLDNLWPMAPELIVGQKVSFAADLYSLGMVAFQLLTGQPPYPKHDDFIPTIMDIMQTPPLRLDAFRSDLPEGLVALVDRLLGKDPEQRAIPAQDLELAFLEGEALRVVTRPPSVKPTDELNQLLGALRQDGDKCDSGVFSLDRIKALEKLRQFQFVRPADYLLALLAAASAVNARSLEVLASKTEVVLKYDCPTLSESQLEDVFSHAFTHRGLAHLAMGVAGALALPGAQVRLRSGPHCLTLSKLENPQVKSVAPVNGLQVTVKHSDCRDCPPSLAERFRLAPIPMFWNGQNINPQPVHLVEDVAVALPGPHPGLYRMLDGMAFAEASHYHIAGAQVVLGGSWKLDLSYQRLVAMNLEQSESLRQKARQRLNALVRQIALEEPITPERMDLYATLCAQDGLQAPLAERLEKAILKWSPDFFHPLPERICPTRSPIRLRPGFLRQSKLNWEQVRTLAGEVHGQSTPAYWETLVRAWHCRKELQPTMNELPHLLTANPLEAQARLAQCPFPRLEDWLLPLFAAALELEATAISVSWSRKSMSIYYQCPPLAQPKWESLFTTGAGTLVPLAVGLAGILRLTSSVAVASTQWAFALRKQTSPPVILSSRLETRSESGLALVFSHDPFDPPEALQERMELFPLPVYWSGRVAWGGPKLHFQDGLSVDFLASPKGYFRMRNGLLFKDSPHFAQVVEEGHWDLDLHFQALQGRPALEEAARDRIAQMARETALQAPLDCDATHLDLYDRLFRELEPEDLDSFYTRLVAEGGNRVHPTLLRAARQVYARNLPGRPQACHYLVNPAHGFLDTLEWKQIKEFLKEALGDGSQEYWQNLLGAWLRSPTLQAHIGDLPDLLRRLAVVSLGINPDDSLLPALQRAFRDAPPWHQTRNRI